MSYLTKIFTQKDGQKPREPQAKTMVATVLAALLVVACVVLRLCYSLQEVATSEMKSVVVLVTYTLAFFFVSALLFKHWHFVGATKRSNISMMLCAMALFVLMHLLVVYAHFPRLLCSTIFFSSNGALDFGIVHSVGELYVDAVMLLFMVTGYFKFLWFDGRRYSHPRSWKSIVFITALTIGILFLYFFIVKFVAFLIGSGIFVINPSYLLSFDAISFLLAYITFVLFCSFAFALLRCLRIIYQLAAGRVVFIVWVGALFVCAAVCDYFLFPHSYNISAIIPYLFLLVYLLLVSIVVFRFQIWSRRGFILSTLNLFFFALLAAWLFFNVISQQEKQHRKQFVQQIVAAAPDVIINGQLDEIRLARIYHDVYVTNDWHRHTQDFSSNYRNRRGEEDIEQTSKLFKQYSFGYFANNRLVDQLGAHSYKLKAGIYLAMVKTTSEHSFSSDDYEHYYIPLTPCSFVLMSHRSIAEFMWLAYFAFFFLLYFFSSLFLYLCSWLFSKNRKQNYSLYNGLMWVMFAVLICMNLVVCVVSIHYNMRQWEQDQSETAMIKSGTICLQLNKSLGPYYRLSNSVESASALDATVAQLAAALFVDINIYDNAGRLQCSSHPDSNRQPKLPADIQLFFADGNVYCSTHEMADHYRVYHVWKALTDGDGTRCGYINVDNKVPRYSFESKFSALITRHLKLFAVMILLSHVVVWLICYFIMSRIEPIQKELKKNADGRGKISLNWTEKEGIGLLIKEHNRLVEELRVNTALQVKSERELAWFEMAKEIAHEIKNPLTPIRLKLQMLQYAWLNRRNDFDDRITQITEDALQQVDMLSNIADSFAEFARTHEFENQLEDLVVLLNEWKGTTHNTLETQYSFNCNGLPAAPAVLDKNLFLQMLTYLVKNSMTNRQENGKLKIDVGLTEDADPHYWLLTFATNDLGLDVTDVSLVFTVRFSAANAGHGIYLPIVKNIVTSFNGQISFVTEKGQGTEFFIKVPKAS